MNNVREKSQKKKQGTCDYDSVLEILKMGLKYEVGKLKYIHVIHKEETEKSDCKTDTDVHEWDALCSSVRAR